MSNEDSHGQNKYDPNVPAVDQVMGILACLSESATEKKTLTEISRQVGIHKSRSYALLTTLQKHNVVGRDPRTKRYYLGPGLLPFTKAFLSRLDIRHLAQPVLDQLSLKTDSTALLGHIDENSVFVIASSEGQHELGITIRTGHRFDLTFGAHGKAIVAHYPDETRRRILNDRPLYFHGDPDHLDRRRLETELSDCRKDGYAVDYGELRSGITAISAPLSGPSGRIVGCVILVGIYSRENVARYGALVAEASKQIMRVSGGTTQAIVL